MKNQQKNKIRTEKENEVVADFFNFLPSQTVNPSDFLESNRQSPLKYDVILEVGDFLNTPSIKIDQELKNLIPKLTEEEREQLEQNIISEGVRDPLVIWKGYNILLDGHNRYEICVKNGIDYELIEIELPTREDARMWIMRNQLGRRNLSPESLSYFRGKLHQAEKQKVKNPTGKNQYSDTEVKHQNDAKANNLNEDKNNEVNCHNVSIAEYDKDTEVKCKSCTQPKSNKLDTGESLANTLKVSRRTIYNDSNYAKAVDSIAEVMGEEIRPQILSKSTTRGSNLTKKKTIELGKLAKTKPDEVREFFEPDVVVRIRKRIERTNEIKFKVGEVVRIVPKDSTDIKHKKGYWGIITAVDELNNCDLKFWNGTLTSVRPHNFVSLNLTPDDCKQMDILCERLSRIREKQNDSIIYHNLQFFAKLSSPNLSEFQEQILTTIEQFTT
jgi:hypothetical protein